WRLDRRTPSPRSGWRRRGSRGRASERSAGGRVRRSRTAPGGARWPRPRGSRPRRRAALIARARRRGPRTAPRLLIAPFLQNTAFSPRVAAVLVNMLRLHRHILKDLFWNFGFTVVVITGVLVIAFTLDFIHRTAIFDASLVLKIIPIALVQTMGTVVPI